MTRINIVEPYQLTDKHLLGEYKEITRIFTLVKKAQLSGKTPKDLNIPENYTLGSGHVTFFYDKIRYVQRRYQILHMEMVRRGFSPDRNKFREISIASDNVLDHWKGDWNPTREEIYLNMARLCKRSKLEKVLEEMASA